MTIKKELIINGQKNKPNSKIKINSLTKVLYENDDQYWVSSNNNSWWTKKF